MAVQLIIDGQHITDVLAQVHALAEATSCEPVKNEAGASSGSKGSTNSAPSTTSSSSTKAADTPADGGKTDLKKTLSREEQDAAVEAMIEQGFKDLRWDQLTKGRQKAVEEALAAKDKAEDAAKAGDDLGSMFDDDEPVEAITADTIRNMMGKLGKDADGNPNQNNLVKIRDILTKYVPKGEEVKVGKIPAAKLAAVHAELKSLEV